jgi:hypothetical protein
LSVFTASVLRGAREKRRALVVVFTAALLSGCAGGAQSAEPAEAVDEALLADAPPPGATMDDVKNIAWELTEVASPGGVLSINRAALAAKNTSAFYTLRLTNEGASGTAAPNKYFAPYKSSEGSTIELFPMRNTLMASIAATALTLSERDYCSYIQNAYRWEKEGGILRLYSRSSGGADVVLSFQQAGS